MPPPPAATAELSRGRRCPPNYRYYTGRWISVLNSRWNLKCLRIHDSLWSVIMIWGRNSEMAVCECVGALVCLLLCSQGSKHLLNEEHSILFYQHLFSVKQFRTLGACCFWPLTAQWDTQGYISLQIFMLFNRETGQWGVLSGGEHKKISGRQSGRHKGRSFRKKRLHSSFCARGKERDLRSFPLIPHLCLL